MCQSFPPIPIPTLHYPTFLLSLNIFFLLILQVTSWSIITSNEILASPSGGIYLEVPPHVNALSSSWRTSWQCVQSWGISGKPTIRLAIVSPLQHQKHLAIPVHGGNSCAYSVPDWTPGRSSFVYHPVPVTDPECSYTHCFKSSQVFSYHLIAMYTSLASSGSCQIYNPEPTQIPLSLQSTSSTWPTIHQNTRNLCYKNLLCIGTHVYWGEKVIKFSWLKCADCFHVNESICIYPISLLYSQHDLIMYNSKICNKIEHLSPRPWSCKVVMFLPATQELIN